LTVAGILLAAGEGRRMGVPKALLADDGGVPYLDRAIGTLLEGGCTSVTVVLGAAATEAQDILRIHGWLEDEDVNVVVNDDWATGMGSSLATGLRAVDADAALVLLVDLPDVHDDAVERLVALADQEVLARATYGGRPGHPVLIGREHWPGVVESVAGDSGARAYLDAHGVRDVPCDDLATGRDLDTPQDLSAPGGSSRS
jgi:molybdenum cofactor cytidylyltransferase/nicotine blue oxidoreductase